ncbi:hypothetical protein ACQ4PT_002297 [Festuca glaucescens]
MEFGGVEADVVVAQDGSGGYTSIAAALADAPRMSTKRYTIHVKKGVYNAGEPIIVAKTIWNLTLVGDGIDATVITGHRSYDDHYPTYQTGTVIVLGQGFIAHDLTVENTAGATKHQAVAFMSESEKSVVYRCAFKGYQDTLYAKKHKQLYHECRIEGTVDFIFGDATAVFQKCSIIARLPLKGQQNTITGQGRVNPVGPSGFSFHLCDISAADELVHAGYTVETYLGRPWKVYSRVVFLECTMSAVVHPKGWLEWNHSPLVNDLFYGEYKNGGPGADVSGRVKWPGYHVIKDMSEASNFTVRSFIQGDEWLPSTGVDYTPGL